MKKGPVPFSGPIQMKIKTTWDPELIDQVIYMLVVGNLEMVVMIKQ
jgi:hypothetical protein